MEQAVPQDQQVQMEQQALAEQVMYQVPQVQAVQLDQMVQQALQEQATYQVQAEQAVQQVHQVQ